MVVGILRASGLVWAETTMEGVFFIMQTYFTDVWKLSFTNAATILNIWGGLYRILPLLFLYLADTLLGNVTTLAFSGVFSTAGIVVITVATTPLFGNIVSGGKCQGKVESECVGHTEKALFITGMALIALGRAARFASTEPFIRDQKQTSNHGEDNQTKNNELMKQPNWWSFICMVLFFFTPIAVIIAFPYTKKWYILFGVSACCTTFATLFYMTGVRTYNKPKQAVNGSPITDFVRVFVATAFNISRRTPKFDDPDLYQIEGQDFESLSSTRVLGFLHKAAIKLPEIKEREGEVTQENKRSWKMCSVSEVESAKALIRLLPICSCFIMFGIVASTGNTYFIEQASHMNSNIGDWKPPLQLLLLVFTLSKYMAASQTACIKSCCGNGGAMPTSILVAMHSVLCCAIAAAVERARVHTLRRHDLLDQPDGVKVPMSAAWLYFQMGFLGSVESNFEYSLSGFLENGVPRSMKKYVDCFVDGVMGVGYLCGALSVYLVGKVSETGTSKNWFQPTLNRSRLDRYYWVLTTLCSLNFIAFVIVLCIYRDMEAQLQFKSPDRETKIQNKLERWCIKRSSALGIILRHSTLCE